MHLFAEERPGSLPGAREEARLGEEKVNALMAGHSTLGALLCELRQSQNRSLETVAGLVSRAAGAPVTCDQVQSWEAGTRTPGPADLGHLAIALEVPLMLLEGALAKQEAVAKRTAKSVDGPDDFHIGRRVRQLRQWRGLSMRAAAELAGISGSYLSQIEIGYRAVTKRSLLEALANALRVAPSDLTDKPWERGGRREEEQAAIPGLEATLTEWWPGEIPDDAPPRPWPEVWADLKTLNEQLRPRSDYAAMCTVLPGLVHDLLVYSSQDEHRHNALIGLIHAYHATGRAATGLGAHHLGYVAAERVQRAAEYLDDPEWLGLAAWTRAQYVSAVSRLRQYSLAVASAEMPRARLETRGMSHLTAALAAASQGDGSTAEVHLSEAGKLAQRLGLANSTWGGATLNFGIVNVGIWRVTIGVELGYNGRVAEIARKVQWQEITRSRQGAYWMDLGRGLLQDKHTRAQGVKAILQAETLTPQQVRNNPFVREAVGDAQRAARREAGGAELRGLAYRLGLAPNG